MPPRRSTRSSTRLSTEPDSNPQVHKQAPSSKRKRSTVGNTDIDGQEDHGKPPSRTTRRTSTKATSSVSTSRASSRLKGSPQGPDGEDEDGEPSRRTKRSRPSHELEDVCEESEEDTKPTIASRTRGAGSRAVASSTNGAIGQDQVVSAEDEPDEQVTAKPTSRTHSSGKPTNSSKPSTSRRGGRLSRSAVAVKPEPLDEPTLENIDDVDDGEIEVPATSQRKISKRSRKVTSLTPPQSVGKEEDTDTGENATAPNSEVVDVLTEKSTPVPSPKKLPSDTPPVYEEKSLLDNLPTSPLKAKRPPLPLEDPEGPRPRLVIHKLVLVNFKSYAGCQEIGPFHRVGCFQCRNIKLISCSLSQPSSDLMVRASRILLMHYFLCLGTVPARCDKENSPNSYTTLRNIRICRSAVWKFISVRLSTLYVHSYLNADDHSVIVDPAWPRCVYCCT
jgi:structural maintenance of chromosome 4